MWDFLCTFAAIFALKKLIALGRVRKWRGFQPFIKMKTFGFEKLEVYVEARKLVSAIYRLSALFPESERFALSDQIHRAAISITSNLAEGTSRISKREKAHFVEISYGSLMEVLSQLQIALDLGYIQQPQYEELHPAIERLAYALFALRRSFVNEVSINTEL